MPELLEGALPTLQALPATLLHSLWQGLLITVLVLGALRRIPVNRPNLRYGVAVTGLLGIVVAALITWCILGYSNHDTGTLPVATTAPEVQPSAATTPSIAADKPLPTQVTQAIPSVSTPSIFSKPALSDYLLWIWFAGFILMTLRLLRLMEGARYLRSHCRPLDDFRTGVLFEEIKEALKLSRHVSLLLSDTITSPLAMGLFWPTVLLPATLVTGLSSDQLRAILAHELAHIRRYDYLVNFIQLIVESIFYYNPAVWWLSHQIRIEREACCDALAVRIVGERVDYAEVLLHLAQKTRQVPSLAAAAQGFNLHDKHQGRLLDRVRRLLLPGYWPQLRLRWYSVALGLLITIALLLGLFQSSKLSVTFAGWFMSDKERISVMTDLNRDFGQPSDYRNDGPRMEVSGEIITTDGKPLPDGNEYIQVMVIAKNSYISECLSRVGGKFHGSVSKGDLYILTTFPGYAPACAGPLHGDVNSQIRDIKIQIVPCKNAVVHFADSNGNPMAGVKVTRMHPWPRRGSSCSSSGIFTRTSDNEGNISIEQATPAIPMELYVNTKGFVEAHRDNLIINAGETCNWVFSTDYSVEGIVVDRTTGKPIADADIAALFERGRGWFGNIEGKQVTTTDLNGHFSVYGVSPGTYYYFVAHAKGYGPEIFSTLSHGKESLTVKLGPRYVHGEIRGNLNLLKLDGDKKGPVISCGMELKLPDEHNTIGPLPKDIPVSINNGVGSFQIDELRAGKLEIEAGSKHLTVAVQDPVDNLIIDLNEVLKKRSLVINLPSPENAPLANGTIKVQRYDVGSTRYTEGDTIQVVNGHAETEVMVPAKVSIDTNGLIGLIPKSTQELWKSWTIPEDTDPYVIDLPLERAGAIQGQVLYADGTPAAQEQVNLDEIKVNGLGHTAYQNCNEKGEFVIQPLPLDRSFEVKVSFGLSRCTKTISLKSWKPLEHVTLKLPAGVDTSVSVLDPEGKPVPSCRIRVSGPGFDTSLLADSMGQCQLKQVNPKEHYTVTACPQEAFQPAMIELSLDASKNIIRVQKGLTLEGTLLMKDTNAPIPNHQVNVFASNEVGKKAYKYYDISTITNAEGKFRFTCLPADSIKLSPEGTAEVYPDDNFCKRSFTPGQKEPVILYMVPNAAYKK